MSYKLVIISSPDEKRPDNFVYLVPCDLITPEVEPYIEKYGGYAFDDDDCFYDSWISKPIDLDALIKTQGMKEGMKMFNIWSKKRLSELEEYQYHRKQWTSNYHDLASDVRAELSDVACGKHGKHNDMTIASSSLPTLIKCNECNKLGIVTRFPKIKTIDVYNDRILYLTDRNVIIPEGITITEILQLTYHF